MKPVIIAIDQGTTSSRAIAFNCAGEMLATAQQEFKQYFPQDGYVEHDPEEIWQTTVETLESVINQRALSAGEIASVGITNQRETTVVWDRKTGAAIHPAIVWQDRRTAQWCEQLRGEGLEPLVHERTGLLLDPYFSGTKISWILDHVPGARARAESGELAFGTIDSWLIWKLTGGARHVTDATNASRTLLFNIHTQRWDHDLLDMLRVPASMLPEVLDSADDFGVITVGACAGVRIGGVAGDQQAALVGQACLQPGQAKSTYGTGCFLMMNTGDAPVMSRNRLLTTVGYRLGGVPTYALEGSIFVAGAAVKWLRDAMRLISDAEETEAIAEKTGDAGGVYLVPAFTGLGAPHWDPHARGALTGLTRDSGLEQVVTATLQSVGYQTRDLLEAMKADGTNLAKLKVDGGMTGNNWVLQFLSDICQMPVERPRITESTALGAASLAGVQAGVLGSLSELSERSGLDRRFEPSMAAAKRERLYAGWQKAVRQVRAS